MTPPHRAAVQDLPSETLYRRFTREWMVITRVIGTVIALTSLASYVWHLAKQGSQPHAIWAIVGGILFIFGLWLALPGRRTH